MGIFTARSGLKWLELRAGDFVWDSNGGAGRGSRDTGRAAAMGSDSFKSHPL